MRLNTVKNLVNARKKNKASLQEQGPEFQFNISNPKIHQSQSKIMPMRLPLQVEIGHIAFTLMPQLSCYSLELILVIIRSLYQNIPKNQPIYIINYTQGKRIGQLVETSQSLRDLLQQSKANYPAIRLYWNHGIKYKVHAVVHDILELQYELDMFDQLFDLIGNIKGEICHKFGLQGYFDFNLELFGDLAGAKKSSFVGSYFSEKQTNNIEFLINFSELFSIEFAKQIFPKNYEDLICPITQIVMRQPIVTKCKHIFDKFALALEIYLHRRCPMCRTYLTQIKTLKQAPKQAKMLKQLEQINFQRKNVLKNEEKGESEPEIEHVELKNMEEPWRNIEEVNLLESIQAFSKEQEQKIIHKDDEAEGQIQY